MVLGPTSRALGRLLKEEEDDEISVLPISIADSYGPLYLCWDTLWMKDHTESYSKGFRIQAFESLEAFRMYYAIGVSVSSLHRVHRLSNMVYACTLSVSVWV